MVERVSFDCGIQLVNYSVFYRWSYQPVLVQPLCNNNPFSLLETELVPVVWVTVILSHNNHQGLGGKEGEGKEGEGRRERGKKGKRKGGGGKESGDE